MPTTAERTVRTMMDAFFLSSWCMPCFVAHIAIMTHCQQHYATKRRWVARRGVLEVVEK